MSADELNFTWPNAPSAQPDNTMAEGQIFDLSGSGSKLGFLTLVKQLGAVGERDRVYYTDGTSSTFQLSVGNFWYQSGQERKRPSNVQVARRSTTPTTRPDPRATRSMCSEQSVPIDPTKTVEAIMPCRLRWATWPGYNPAMHIFAASIGG